MASTTETGHAKNVANFDDFISFVTGYGAAFNPRPKRGRFESNSINNLVQRFKSKEYSRCDSNYTVKQRPYFS